GTAQPFRRLLACAYKLLKQLAAFGAGKHRAEATYLLSALQSQRDCVLQPRVARNELPSVEGRTLSNPERVPATALNTHGRAHSGVRISAFLALLLQALAAGLMIFTILVSARAAELEEEIAWPCTRSTNGNSVTMYQPQVERWTSNWFMARA